jgi:hypothetical protein
MLSWTHEATGLGGAAAAFNTILSRDLTAGNEGNSSNVLRELVETGGLRITSFGGGVGVLGAELDVHTLERAGELRFIPPRR